MTGNMTAGSAIVERRGRFRSGRRLGDVPSDPPLLLPRAPSGRLSVIEGYIGAHRVLLLSGTVDIASAPRLVEVLEHAAGSRDPLALDLGRAVVPDAAGMALLAHAVRWVRRRRADAMIVCPPGPARAELERRGITARGQIVGDGQPLAGTPSATASNDERALVVQSARRRAKTLARRATLLAEATLALEERYDEPELALGDVARQIATSERQLQRVFAELAASSFRDELAAVRMQHGARLLRETYMTVGEIAPHVGYRQAGQFAKAFRRFHGVTPTEFGRHMA
jgi:AraC family transcriptional regulator, regulatory protein of adaptative response / methylphosphotriester-DNA alkyltransferase methyltransferase